MYQFILIFGIVSYAGILFSFLTGLKIIKLNYKVHRAIGIISFIFASSHALVMLYYNYL